VSEQKLLDVGLTREQIQIMDDARASLEAIACDPLASAMQKRIKELEADAARYESGRVILTGMVEELKAKIVELEAVKS
jgi:hypothetical protein